MTIPGRIGIVLRDALPWEHLVQIAETADETGFDAVFVPEIAGREAFATLAGLAGSTNTIRLGTGVVTIGSRDPITVAMGAATIHELSNGRMVLGLGAGDEIRRAARYGGGVGALDVMGHYVGVAKRLLAGEEVEPDTVLRTPSFRLDMPPTGPPPPIWVGALGDGMISLAGSAGDGAILNWCTPGRVGEARELVDRELARSGRERAAFTLAVYVRATLGLPDTMALDALRPMVALYASIPHYRVQMEGMGLGEEAALAAKAADGGRLEDVPEGLVRALAIVGGRNEAMARFQEYLDAGADLLLCYPVAAVEPFSSILRTVLAAAPTPAVER
jgi:5,10-methylenetetrahydromethanopterin reductase